MLCDSSAVDFIFASYKNKNNHMAISKSKVLTHGLVGLWCFNASFNNISVIS